MMPKKKNVNIEFGSIKRVRYKIENPPSFCVIFRYLREKRDVLNYFMI